ncbi:MAG: hypothetical protein Q7T19_00710 [Caulobacter sp.]|nr:hypothetical protein [Caulobacter sp.]
MNPEILRLWRSRPFQIAAVWEVLCVGAGIVSFYRTGVEIYAVAGIFAGVVPMSVVMLLFLRSQKAGAAADRSKDIVQ